MWVFGMGHRAQVGSVVVLRGGEASRGNGGAQEALGRVRGGPAKLWEVSALPFHAQFSLFKKVGLSLSLSICSSLYSSSLSLSGLSRWLCGRMEVPEGKRKKEGRRWLLDCLGAVEEWVQLGSLS